MIPQEKAGSVARALEQTFGVSNFEEISRITRGLSSDLVFRVVVQGSPYLLRIMTHMDERMDPRRIFACMNMASEAGLTPHLRYSSLEDGISITDFVEAVPLPLARAFAELPVTLRKLHALPPFPKEFNHVTAHRGFIWRFRKAGLLPQDQVEKAFTAYEQICAIYPRLDSDMVSSHMDLKPENILFDGQRVWLVDWQAAFLNDRYFDLAVVANFVIENDGDEIPYLARYFGHSPDEYQLARFFLMRQMLHLFAATVFLLLGAGGKPVDLAEERPSFRAFHQQIWAGEINLADPTNRITYGLIHWKQFQLNTQQPRFFEALRTVSEAHAGEKIRPLLPVEQ